MTILMNSSRQAVATVVVISLTTALVFGGEQDPWLDEVVLFDQPPGSSDDGGPPEDALGPPDGGPVTGYVSVDIPETLVLAFVNNTAFDGDGDDLFIYQWSAGDSSVDIYASQDNSCYVYLGQTTGDVAYDLADYAELDAVNFIKFVGLDDGGFDAGYDVDAVEALNSGEHIDYGVPGDCEACDGDANGDGLVDPLDSGFVLARFGCPVGTGDPDCDTADMNGDGLVDPLDVGFILARFGECS